MSDRKKNASDAGRGADGRERGMRQSTDSASGFVADDSAGVSSVGQNAQHDTQASSGRYTNFNSAPPESNVGPPGAPQTSHGNAGGPVPGGTVEKAEAGSRQQAMGAAAAGGNPGTSMGSDTPASRGGAQSPPENLSERLADGAESSGTPGDAPR